MQASTMTVIDLAKLLKVIADETRLRILGVLAEQPATGKELAQRLDLTPPTISHHMKKLVEAGIITAENDAQRHWYRLNGDLLLASKRVPLQETATTAAPEPKDEEARFRAKVIRDFFDGESLKEIPAQRKRRVVVLQHIMGRFAPDRTYQEREINDLLRPTHPDFATLRRELVEYGYLRRDRGTYQVTRVTPERTQQTAQEITGDERTWLSSLLNAAVEMQS